MNNSHDNYLKPQTIAEIINKTFQLYQQHFIDFVSLVAVLVIPLTVITSSISASFPNPAIQVIESGPSPVVILPDGFGLYISLQIFGAFLQGIVASGLISYIIAERVLGYRLNIFEAFNAASQQLLKLAGGLLTYGVVFLVGLFVLALLGSIFFLPLFGIPVLMYLGVATYFFVIPIFMLEKVDIPTGLSRALMLGKARFWQTLGLVVALAVVAGLISTLLTLFMSLIFGDAMLEANNPIFLTFSVIINILVAPLHPENDSVTSLGLHIEQKYGELSEQLRVVL